MSMDSNQEPETVDGTDRVYTLCLRAQKREEGKAPTISNAMDPIAFEHVSTTYKHGPFHQQFQVLD